MVADHLPLPYQDPPDSTTPHQNVLIVEDVEQAARELRAQHEADRRIGQFHGRRFITEMVRANLIIKATVEGDEETIKALVRSTPDT